MNTKYNKILVLAIAGLMLAVVTCGTAFASTTWNYVNYPLASTWNLNTPTFSTQPSGAFNSAKVGDYLTWENTLHNSYNQPAAAWGDYSNVGLSWVGYDWSSDPTVVNAGVTTPQIPIILSITSPASSPIYAYHDYTCNQQVYPSAFSTQMIYTATS